MSIKNKVYDFIHIFITRDLVGPIGKSKYATFGEGSRIFKPLIHDKYRNKVSIGNDTIIGKHSRIQCYPDENMEIGHLIIGNGCRIGNRCSFLCGGDITIGNGVLMASDILVASENHSIDPESLQYYMSQPLKCNSVEIMDGSWIGEKVCILPGVSIGYKSIIGAGSVVTKSIPDYCIAVGNPAKIIKKWDFETHKWVSKK